MKFIKWLVAILGLVALAVGGYYFFRSWVDTRSLVAVANANRSTGFASPWPLILMTIGLMTLGGLLLGLGLGMPTRTAGSIRKEAIEGLPVQREADRMTGERDVVVERTEEKVVDQR